MKKKLVFVAALALMLSGCAGSPTVEETAATEAPTVDISPEDAFLKEFRDANPDADRATDEQWLTVGDSVCSAFESGATPNQIVDSMQDSSLDPEEAASVIIVASEHLCPEFAP